MLNFLIVIQLLSVFYLPQNKGFAIYSFKNNVVDYSNYIIKEEGIIGYKWNEHEILINEKGSKELENKTFTIDSFAVCLGKKLLYIGSFQNIVAAKMDPAKPKILYFTPGGQINLGKTDKLQISKQHNGIDLRNNHKLYNYLKKRKLLIE